MYTRITVGDLTKEQWSYLRENLPERYGTLDGGICVRVVFEPEVQLIPRVAEMPVRAFVALMNQLQEVGPTGPASTAVSRTCDHGMELIDETPSAFDGGPVCYYADGCMSVGPYRRV